MYANVNHKAHNSVNKEIGHLVLVFVYFHARAPSHTGRLHTAAPHNAAAYMKLHVDLLIVDCYMHNTDYIQQLHTMQLHI